MGTISQSEPMQTKFDGGIFMQHSTKYHCYKLGWLNSSLNIIVLFKFHLNLVIFAGTSRNITETQKGILTKNRLTNPS